jgi:O-antigen ligase
LLAAIFALEPTRPLARAAPVLMAAIFAVSLLAQYRALLATTAITLVAVGVLLRRRARGLIVSLIAVVAFTLVFSYVASHFPALKLETTATTLSQTPWTYARERLQATKPTRELYNDKPLTAAVGTGPGTFSSRAWQTFARAESTSKSNVQAGYAKTLTGGIYNTDVSERYITPYQTRSKIVEGSRAVSSPHSSYLALAAEVGLLGLAIVVFVYIAALICVARIAIRLIGDPLRGDSLPGLAVATTIGFLALLQMGLLENWFEVTRITFIIWAMLGVVTKEFDFRQSP